MALTSAQTAEVKRILATGDKTKAQEQYKKFDSYNSGKNTVEAKKENVNTASLQPINQAVLQDAWNGNVARPTSTPVAKPAVSTQTAPKPTAPDMSKVQTVSSKPAPAPVVAKPTPAPVSTQTAPKPTAPDMSKVQAVVAKPATTPMVSKAPETAKKVPTGMVDASNFDQDFLTESEKKEVAELRKTNLEGARLRALELANAAYVKNRQREAEKARLATAATAPSALQQGKESIPQTTYKEPTKTESKAPTSMPLDASATGTRPLNTTGRDGTPAEAPVDAPLTVSTFEQDTDVTLEDIRTYTGKDLKELTPERVKEIQSNVKRMLTEDPSLLENRQLFDRMVSYIKKTPDEDQAVNYMYDRMKTGKLAGDTNLTDTERTKLQYAAENRAKGIKIEESNYENTKSTLQDNLKSRLDLYDKQNADLKSNLDKQLKDNEAQIDSFRSNMYQQLGGRAKAISRIVSPSGTYLGDEQMIALMGETGVKGMQSIVEFKNKIVEKNNELINKAQAEIFKLQETGQIASEEAKKAIALAEYQRDQNNQKITEAYYNNIFGVTAGAETREEKLPEVVSAYAKAFSMTPEQNQYFLKLVQDKGAKTTADIAKIIANDAYLKKAFQDNQAKADAAAIAKASGSSNPTNSQYVIGAMFGEDDEAFIKRNYPALLNMAMTGIPTTIEGKKYSVDQAKAARQLYDKTYNPMNNPQSSF